LSAPTAAVPGEEKPEQKGDPLIELAPPPDVEAAA
jgi:hypothetical protein